MRLPLVAALLFSALGAILPAAPAQALCEGRDLIAEMPAAQSAPLQQAAATTPYGSGLLWNAARGGQSVTIFGTYHFRHDHTLSHLDQLGPLIDAAQRVYLESGGTDMQEAQRAMASEPGLLFITQGPTLIDRLTAAEWQTYSEAMAQRGIPGFMAAKFKPFMASMTLSIGPCLTRSGIAQQPGIDMLVNTRAGDKARSLEDWRETLTLLDTLPPEEQLDMLRLSFGYIDDADDMSHTLLQRYLDGQVSVIWEYSRALSLQAGSSAEEFAKFEEIFLNARNRAWADLLARDLSAPDAPSRSFIAVGAGHLPGQQGLLNLLQDQGFTISALPFSPRG